MARLTGFVITARSLDYDAEWMVVAAVDSMEEAKTVIVEEVTRSISRQLDATEGGGEVHPVARYRVHWLT